MSAMLGAAERVLEMTKSVYLGGFYASLPYQPWGFMSEKLGDFNTKIRSPKMELRIEFHQNPTVFW